MKILGVLKETWNWWVGIWWNHTFSLADLFVYCGLMLSKDTKQIGFWTFAILWTIWIFFSVYVNHQRTKNLKPAELMYQVELDRERLLSHHG